MENRERKLQYPEDKGYNLEHNFGHGKANLSAILATLNLLAFAFHTIAELTHDCGGGP